MQILTKPEEFIVFQALGMLADALDADLEEGNISDADKPYVVQMMEDAKKLQDRYAPAIH